MIQQFRPRPTDLVPREVQAAIRQHLTRMDERVLHTLTLADGTYVPDGSAHTIPPLPWHWLAVSDRQLLLFRRAAGESEVRTLLACPHVAVLAVEVGSVLLSAWLRVIWAEPDRDYRETSDEQRPSPEQSPLARPSPTEQHTQLRIEFPASLLVSVQAAIRDLLPAIPHRDTRQLRDATCLPEADSAVVAVQPPFREAVAALTSPGESITAVLYAPPAAQVLRRKIPWQGQAPQEQPWRGVAVTDQRLLLLEQPAPLMTGGLRFGCVVTQVAPHAVTGLELMQARADATGLHVRVQRGTATHSYVVELDDRQASHWSAPLDTLRATVQAARMPLTAEHRAFVAATGLHGIVLTEPSHYVLVLRQIKEHHYYLGQHGRATTLVEAARDWHGSLYTPITLQLTAQGATGMLPQSTTADLYLRLCEYKWLASERLGADIGFELAVQAFQYWVA